MGGSEAGRGQVTGQRGIKGKACGIKRKGTKGQCLRKREEAARLQAGVAGQAKGKGHGRQAKGRLKGEGERAKCMCAGEGRRKAWWGDKIPDPPISICFQFHPVPVSTVPTHRKLTCRRRDGR